MAGVAQEAGYRTGHVQLFRRNVMGQSNVSREIKRIDAEKPDLLAVSVFIDHINGNRQTTKAVRLLVSIMERQLRSGRQLLLFGHDNAAAWTNADLVSILRDARLSETRLRWCNLVGPQPYTDGPGFRSVTKIFSNVPLWNGPPGADLRCELRLQDHDLYDDHLTGPSNYERRRQLWQGIT